MSDGRCLSHAFSEMIRRDDSKEKVYYIQGDVTNPATARTFKHAWVESNGKVIDPTIDIILEKKDYYSRFNVKNIIKIEPFIAIILFGRGLHFVTKEEVSKAVKRDKELMAQVLARRKKEIRRSKK